MRKIFGKCLAGILALGLAGCENPYESQEPEKPNYDTSNDNQGRENFEVWTGLGQVTKRTSSEVQIDVYPNTVYGVVLKCSNDGDADRLGIYIEGVRRGSFVTAENRRGGNGWYMNQFTQEYDFTTTGKTARLRVDVESTDKWGVWPKEWIVSKK